MKSIPPSALSSPQHSSGEKVQTCPKLLSLGTLEMERGLGKAGPSTTVTKKPNNSPREAQVARGVLLVFFLTLVSASTSQVSDQDEADALIWIISSMHDTCLLIFPGALLA